MKSTANATHVLALVMLTTLPMRFLSATTTDFEPELKTPYPPIKKLNGDYAISLQEFALKTCLDINYEKIGAYQIENLKDYTNLKDTLPAIERKKLVEFTKINTNEFYTENLPIKSEEQKPPYNAIFGRCMNFYKSKKLIKLINKLQNTK